ncbi:MAG: LemA family protein [Verrucomicrobiota bacterium]
MEILILPAALGLIALLWLMGTYNGLIRLRNHCRESWADIDTELKRRHDLIPNVVAVVKGYAAHEQQLFEEIAAARARANTTDRTGTHVGDLCRAENELLRGVRQVFAVAEAYPALKADAQFLRLQQELVNTEDRIQASRRFFNANVRDLNNRVESVPSSLVASMAGIGPAEFFEVEDLAIRATAAVRF